MIDPIYEEVSFFSEGLSFVRRGERYTFIDAKGIEQTKPQFTCRWSDDCYFQGGLARVEEGYINSKGTLIWKDLSLWVRNVQRWTSGGGEPKDFYRLQEAFTQYARETSRQPEAIRLELSQVIEALNSLAILAIVAGKFAEAEVYSKGSVAVVDRPEKYRGLAIEREQLVLSWAYLKQNQKEKALGIIKGVSKKVWPGSNWRSCTVNQALMADLIRAGEKEFVIQTLVQDQQHSSKINPLKWKEEIEEVKKGSVPKKWICESVRGF